MIKYILTIFLSIATLNGMGMPADYYKIQDTKTMKTYFFTYMSNLAYAQNKYILDDRKFIQNFYSKKDTIDKSSQEYKRFEKITNKYNLFTTSPLKMYLKRIDVIPVSLILAQASIESGWGKSRFTREANNLFGQWTWSGKGLVPKSRDVGKKHRIRVFPSFASAMRAYMYNLNRNRAYKDLRTFRATQKEKGIEITGLSLAHTLINYSQIREKYVKMLKQAIKSNNLERFNK